MWRSGGFAYRERELIKAMRAAVKNGEALETTDADDVKSLAAVLGCAWASESGVRVDVAELLDASARGRRSVDETRHRRLVRSGKRQEVVPWLDL